MSHLIKFYAVCKFSYFRLWYLTVKELNKFSVEDIWLKHSLSLYPIILFNHIRQYLFHSYLESKADY